MVFFGFWLSHVPAEKLAAFLDTVQAALKPGARLFLVDSLQPDLSNSRTQTENLDGDRQQRVLKDGRRFEIVKIYYDLEQLTETLRRHSFDIEVRGTANFFLYADGRRAS